MRRIAPVQAARANLRIGIPPPPSVLGNGPGRGGGTRRGELRLRESGCEGSVRRTSSAKSNFTTGSGEARFPLHTRRALSANRVDESIVLAHAKHLNRNAWALLNS